MNEKIYTCECGKEFTYSQAYNGHKSTCTVHHITVYGSTDRIETRRKKLKESSITISKIRHENAEKQKETALMNWITEKHTCMKCGKIMTEKFGTGRFCSCNCANSKPSKKKAIVCEKCGIEFIADIRHKPICDSCKKLKLVLEKICKICGSMGCTNDFCRTGSKLAQLKTLTKYFRFNSDYIGTSDVFSEWDRVREQLIQEYWIERKTANQIAEFYSYPGGDNLLTHVFSYLDIKTKSKSEGVKDAIINGRVTFPCNTTYKHGWHKTWMDTNVYLRSSYEFELAEYFDENQIKYEVESLRVPYFDHVMNKQRVAIPDFYLPDYNLIIEVKSDYTLNVPEMKDKKSEYESLGYDFVLICDHKKLNIDNIS